QQSSWVEREISPLKDWVDYCASRAIWPDLAFRPWSPDAIRRLPPQRRHHIAWKSLNASETARVERLLDDIERLSKELSSSWIKVAIGIQAWPTDALLNEELIREAARFIEIERLSLDLDPYCVRRGDP